MCRAVFQTSPPAPSPLQRGLGVRFLNKMTQLIEQSQGIGFRQNGDSLRLVPETLAAIVKD